MAITLVAHQTATSAAGGNITSVAINTASADLIVVAIAEYAPGSPHVTLSDSKSNTWIPCTAQDGTATGNAAYLHLAYVQGVGIGAASHTFTLSSTGTCYGTMYVFAFSGSGASPLDASQNGAVVLSAATLASGSITPSVPGSVVISALCTTVGNTAGAIAGTGVTQADAATVYFGGEHVGGAAGYVIQTTAAAVNSTWTWTGACGAAAVVAAFHAQAVLPVGLFAMTPIQIWDH